MIGRVRITLALAATAVAVALPQLAQAADPLGFYIGAGVGQSTVRFSETVTGASFGFSEHDTGWKLVAGLRPVSLVGAEVEYLDFGHSTVSSKPIGIDFDLNADVRSQAATLLGVLYAPIPLPVLDLYAKAGIARLRTTANGVAYNYPISCGIPCTHSFQSTETASRFAYGAGVQFKFSSFAIRAEYERIDESSGNPDLLSVGVTWTF